MKSILSLIIILGMFLASVGCGYAESVSSNYESKVSATTYAAITTLQSETETTVTEQNYPSLLQSTDDIVLCDIDGLEQSYSFIYDDETFFAYYQTDNWKIIDSYKINNQIDITIICQALTEIHPIHSADFSDYRTADDMAYEWIQHNLAYRLLPDSSPWKNNTKDVDLAPSDQGKSAYDMFIDRFDISSVLP